MQNDDEMQEQLSAEVTRLRQQVDQLRARVANQEQTEAELKQYRDHFEELAAARTTEWVAANEKLLQQIVEREWAEEALRQIKQRYELAIKAGRVGVWDLDLWSNEIYLDSFLQTTLGFEKDKISSLDDWMSHVHPDDAERVGHTVRTHFAGGTPNFELEQRMIHQDGSIRWFLVRGSTLRDENGKPYRLIGTNTDITEYKQAEAALRQYTTQLQAHNAELDAFAHTVAHDLKNPLTALTGVAEILAADYILDEELNHYLTAIVRGGRKAINIVEELLVLASVRQQEDIGLEQLDMGAIVAETQERLRYMIGETEAQITTPPTWPMALGYAPWIEEIWANYLSNALKYGGQPPHLELGSTVQSDGQIRFWVRDNGPGLSQEEQARLFTRFTQLKQARAKGHGLGLSIVRRIATKLGGQVGVESDGVPGHGSTFYFTLPQAEGNADK